MDRNSSVQIIGGIGLGLCLGAGLMYYLDPDRGRRRRALVRDKAVHLQHETGHAVNRKARHIGNRARGLVAEARGALGLRSERTYGRNGTVREEERI
jgi:hypothetical protein